MSLVTSARPPTPTIAESVKQLLQQHRSARLDQMQALALIDLTVSELDPEARLDMVTAARMTLEDIDAALLRLDDGSYGMCQSCAKQIAAERLLALPYTRYCLACAGQG